MGGTVARPKKEINARQFESLCGLQCTKEEICLVLDVTDKTLESWCKRTYGGKGFSEVFRQKRGIGRVSLRRSQFELAQKGNVTMLIWLGRQYLGQSEEPRQEDLEKRNEDDALTLSLIEEARRLENANKP